MFAISIRFQFHTECSCWLMLSGLAVGCPNTGLLIFTVLMDNNRCIEILFWNVKGINFQNKWDAIRDKITESANQIICLQETKRENFDPFYIKKFCHRNLDTFAYSPSVGASGRI